ncbi:MAG: septum formation initiator family protein [Nitrospirae bacterium]|nr:MAG: septum formation initiator family protein [Nitrospirota bacterium]
MPSNSNHRDLREQVAAEKKLRNIVFYSIAAIILIYAAATLFFGEMGFIKFFHLNNTKKKLETEIVQIERQNRELKTQVKSLKEDPFYMEKRAREDYGLAKQDEYIFKFEDK